MKTRVLLSFIVLLSNICFASGDIIGNGGYVYVRERDNGTYYAEVVDAFEARVFRELNINLELPENPVNQTEEDLVLDKVNLGISRLEGLDPVRAQRLHRYANSFFKEALFPNEPVNMGRAEDLGTYASPRNENPVPVVIQNHPLLPRGKKYLIDAELWNLLDKDNKAVLILHEVILREWLGNNFASTQTTEYVRLFNSYLFTGFINEIKSRNDLLNFYQDEVKIRNYELGEYNICLNQEYAFYEDGSVQYFTDDHNRKKYYLNSDGSLRYGFVSNSNYDVINIEGQELVVDQADFYPNHSIKFLALHQYYMNPTINIASAKYQTTILGEKVVLKGSLSFHPNGQIKQFILDEEAHFVGEGYDIWAQIGELYSNGKINWLETSVSTNGMNSFVDREGADKPFNYHVQCGGFEHIYYWPNGNLKKIKSIGEDNFIHLFGNVLYLKNNTEIEFYENGFLKGAEFGNNTVNKITINDSDVVGVEKIELWDTGVIKEIIADSSHLQATMKVNFQGKLTRFFINHLSFYPTGEFHYGILDEWEKFDSANDSHYYADDTFIYADRSAILQGSVEEFWKLTNPERVSVLEMVKNF